MSAYEDDIDPIDDPSDGIAAHSNANGKRKREDDAPGLISVGSRREQTPEPDEELEMSLAGQQAWLVKLPNFLLKAWSQIERGDVTLGHIRVYNPEDKDKVRMELRLPEHPLPAVPSDNVASSSSQASELDSKKPKLSGQSSTANTRFDIPRVYALHQIHTDEARPKNLYVFREKEIVQTNGSQDAEDDEGDDRESSSSFRKRRAVKTKQSFAGIIANEASARPIVSVAGGTAGPRSMITPEYREVIRRRQQEASKPKQSIKMLEDDVGTSNMLASGARMGHQRGPQSMLIRPKLKATTEKFARLPKNELLDLLFAAFERYPYWGLKTLRAETQQPESYLRDVLTGIADLHRNGPYVGQWSLKETYKARRRETEQEDRAAKEAQAKQAHASGSATASGSNAQEVGDDDDDDDDDDDADDFEEVI